MRRKIYISLGLMTLLLCFLTGAMASYNLTKSEDSNLAVIYVPGTQVQTEVDTAIFIKEALKARFPGEKNLIKNISSKSVREEPDNNIFKTSQSTREKTLNEKICEELRKDDYHVWFLVPDQAAEDFCSNTELFEQLKELMQDRIMRIHIVFIGDKMVEPSETSALSQFAAETKKADWGWAAGDFLSTAQRTEANRKVYTGNYFIASLFGKAAELPVTREKESVTFTLPGGTDGTVLVVSKVEQLNQPVTIKAEISGTDSDITVPKKGAFRISKLEGLSAGEHTIQVSGGDKYTRVYFYPDLNRVNPSVKIGNKDSETIERGKTEIVLTVENDLGLPSMFSVSFDCGITGVGGDVSPLTLPAEYDETGKRWRAMLTTGTEDTAFTVLPKISYNATDGNAVDEWQGAEMQRKIETVGVTVLPSAPAEAVLYYDENRSGKIAFKWTDFFSYNTADNLLPAISEAEKTVAENLGFIIENTQDGFALSVNLKNTAEGTVMAGGDGEATITLDCGGVSMPLLLRSVSVSALKNTLHIGTDAAEVKAGGKFTLYAEIPAETAAHYEAAHKQNDGFYLASDLMMKVESKDKDITVESKDEDITAAAAETAFENTNGVWRAEIGMKVSPTPAAGKDGSLKISAKIVNEKEDALIQDIDSVQVAVINKAPHLDTKIEKTDKTIELRGVPIEWKDAGILKSVFGEGQEICLLQKAFGTGDLFTLFKDDETEITSVKVRVEPAEGLLPEEGTVLEKGQKLTVPAICRAQSQKYTIRVTASDGVNESAETAVTLTLQSSMVRIVNYIVLGLIALIVILIALLIIRQIRKPSFDSINIRCLVTTDQPSETCRELMSKSRATSMIHFHKKPAPLSAVLTMTHQPPLSGQAVKAADDIMLLPSRHDEIIVVFGKTALMEMSSHDKKETITIGMTYSLRMPDNTNILIENVG